MTEYSQGVCRDGAAILKDGNRMTVDQIVLVLNKYGGMVDSLSLAKDFLDAGLVDEAMDIIDDLVQDNRGES